VKLDQTVKLAPLASERASSANQGAFIATLVVSVLVHVGFVGGLMAMQGRKPRTVDLQRAIPVQLVKLGKRRDPKLLPRKVRRAPPPKSEGVALDTGKKKDDKPAKKRDDRPRKAPELSDAARRMLAEATLDEAFEKLGDDEAEGSPDGSPHGTTTDATNAAAGYQAAIARTLSAKYRLPQSIPASQRQFLKARVVLWIEPNGRVSQFDFLERHPNRPFMVALESLLKSITLPPPPKDLAGAYRDDGVEIIFRP